MFSVKRTVVTNAKGYKEVELSFRKARAAALEAAGVNLRKDRIVCPVLDAARTDSAYGAKALPTTDKTGLDQFADGLGLSKPVVEGFTYLSGPVYKIPSNTWNRTFEDTQVNTGFIKSLKNDVHTSILSTGTFAHKSFNQFVWAIHPDLKDSTIDNAFLHSKAGDDLYVGSDKLDKIMEHNEEQSNSIIKVTGNFISKIEMENLLLGKMGQTITPDPNNKAETIQAISVRDLHDLYSYGVFPATVEDQLLEAGLIQDSSLAMSGKGH